MVFTRMNRCNILAVKPDMDSAYLVECKDCELSPKQQCLAVRELDRNYVCALDLLLQMRLPRGQRAMMLYKGEKVEVTAKDDTKL